MLLVNSLLAIVGCPRKYHEKDILKSCCSVPASPGLTSETLTSAMLVG